MFAIPAVNKLSFPARPLTLFWSTDPPPLLGQWYKLFSSNELEEFFRGWHASCFNAEREKPMLEPEPVENAETEQPVKGRRWILIASAAAVLIVLAVAVAAWAGGFFGEAEPAAADAKVQRVVNEVISLEPVVVNLVSPGRMSYARIGISLGVHNPSPGRPALNEDLVVPKVKDRLLSLLGGMDSGRLLQAETKDEIKAEVLGFVREMIGNEQAEVVEVYFTDFIIQ